MIKKIFRKIIGLNRDKSLKANNSITLQLSDSIQTKDHYFCSFMLIK